MRLSRPRMRPLPVRRLLRLGAVLVSAGGLGYLGVLLVIAVVPHLVGWDSRTVLTGSMAPTIPPGCVVLSSPVSGSEPGPDDDVAPGSVLVVREREGPDGVYVHRVVGRDEQGLLVTRGDANPWPDTTHVKPEQILGRVRVIVPVAGWPLVWWHRQQWPALGAVLGLTWLGAVVLLRGRPEEDAAPTVDPVPSSAVGD